MKVSDIRAMTVEEMEAKILDLKEEHFNLRFQHSIGQLENPALLGKVKRDIAQVMTVKKEVELKKNTGE